MAIPIKTKSCKVCTNKSSCFKQLSLSELEMIDENRLEINYKKGEMVCKQGSFASHILFLKKGLIKLYIEGKDKNLIIAIVPAGNLIGLPSLFGDPIFHYSAVTYEDSTVCLLNIEVFRDFTKGNAKFSSEVIKIINESTIQSYDRFSSISQKNMHGRFADVVLCLSNAIYNNAKFNISFSRKDLAELASMSIESLSRVIKEFDQDKIVSIKGKEFEIIDPKRLLNISQKG
jgi:CRP/FNR family transcriptional regulator